MSGISKPGTGIILFGHGSRDPLWRRPIEAVAARLLAAHPELAVACAYLELQQPDLASAAAALVDEGATGITIVPMFLGTGRHAREDVPVLLDQLRLAHPGVRFKLQPPVGEDPRVLDLLATIAVE
jgi:sirohydrochlorin cobaltochelatase